MTRPRKESAVKRHLRLVPNPHNPPQRDPARVRAVLAPRRLSLVRLRGAA
ncbi:hypothetical protein AB0878_17405 [Amycolatopsis sp. NPDC047767]